MTCREPTIAKVDVTYLGDCEQRKKLRHFWLYVFTLTAKIEEQIYGSFIFFEFEEKKRITSLFPASLVLRQNKKIVVLLNSCCTGFRAK